MWTNINDLFVMKDFNYASNANTPEIRVQKKKKLIYDKESIIIRDFDDTEINELQTYINSTVPHTFLNHQNIITENPILKSGIFLVVYRIFKSCREYATTEALRDKLDTLLEGSSGIRNELYPLNIKIEKTSSDYQKSLLSSKVIYLLTNPINQKRVDNLIDAFLVFGEKIQLFEIENVQGLSLETDEGQAIVKEIEKVMK